MAIQYKCPKPPAECAWTDFEPIDVTSQGDPTQLWLCAECNGTWPPDAFRKRPSRD